jgi:hypothetical protein
MKPIRTSDLMLPFERGPGRRTPQTLLLIDERDALLREAARFYPGVSDREVARQVRIALLRYRACRWRRECSETTCPHAGRLDALLWAILKTRDVVPSDRLIRLVLARSPLIQGVGCRQRAECRQAVE